MTDYLYHYTSIESLVQIVENNQIMFNNLKDCDDLEEAESSDLGKFGRFVFVSCWTDNSEESIPMWCQYSGNMHGVRIGMQKSSFARDYSFSSFISGPDAFHGYLDSKRYYDNGLMMTLGKTPELINVDYTEDEELLCPKIIVNGTKKDINNYIDNDKGSICLSSGSIGQYKRKVWSFQKEVRYKFTAIPIKKEFGESRINNVRNNQTKHMLSSMIDEGYCPPYKRVFMALNKDSFDDCDIVFGPKMTDSEKILIKTFLKKHNLEKNCRESMLRIQ